MEQVSDNIFLSFATKYNLEETDVKQYAESMKIKNLGGASYVFQNIRRKVRLDNSNDSLMQFSKRFAPIREKLYEEFGNIDELREEAVRAQMEERNVMEAARKRIEEEAAKESERLEEFELMTDEEMDDEYSKAMEDNNESRMRDLVNEAARRKGYMSTDEFRMAHRAPSYDEEGYDKSLVDVAGNKDRIRESLNEQLRMNRDKYRDESAASINKALDAIDKGEKSTVTIYRAVPKSLKEGKVRNGDWVSLSESYVNIHGEHALEGDYKIMKEEVPAENLYWDGSDINEWGYDDRNDYRYKNTKNNKKLDNLITRDDKGNIIPLSKRFNSRKNDIRFREVYHGTSVSFTDYKSVKVETVRDENISTVLDAAREKLEDIEQEWQDRILDYIAEHYPTQATVSAQTRSPEGLKDREAMKKDRTLKKMREEAVTALNAADEKVMEAFKKENGDILFREVKESDGGKSLVGLHNISEEKLLKALKLGGLANPSAAVIDIATQSHEGYGEISLVLPSSMIDKRTGRNAGTFSGDAWTPVYPQIERQFSDDGSQHVRDAVTQLPQEMQSDVRSAWNSYMDGREGNALAYQFLYERGEAPELRKVEPLFGEHLRNQISAIDALNDYDKRSTALLEAYIEENFGGDQTKFKDYIETRKRVLQDKIQTLPKQKGFAYRKAVEKLNDIEERGYEYNSVQNFYNRVKADIRQAGGVDTYHTLQDALDKINGSEALSKQYAEWRESLAGKYGIKEVLFKGYTPDGIRIYLPHTLENVSGLMKQQGLTAATGWGGSFSKFAAGLMKPTGTLDGIRRQKGKLTSDHSDLEAFRTKWEEVYFDLGIKLNPDGGTFDDTGLYRVEEIALKPDPGSFAKREYGVELAGEDVRQLKKMVDAIRNEYPAMYFETKFERPVYLNEFVAAVVPQNVNEDVSKAIRESGLQVFVYKPKDESSRNEAVKQASEINGVRFRLTGEKRAATSSAPVRSGQVFLSRDKRMTELYRHASSLAEKQHIPVNIIHSIGEVDSPKVRDLISRGKDIRGWYDLSSDRICLYLPKARGKEDIERTLLHEGVGHYGLRKLAGRKHMDAFLDDIFTGCGEKIRGEIVRLAGAGKMDIRTATEEYLAQMAENGTDDTCIWDKIRLAFRNLLRKLGFSIEIGERELKGLLTASRENLKKTATASIPEKIQTAKGELAFAPGYSSASIRRKDSVQDATFLLERMKKAGIEPASLSRDEWESLFGSKGMVLSDGRIFMAVKEPAGYGLKISDAAVRNIKTLEMEI